MAALDSAELTWTVEKKNAKGKKVTVQQTNYNATGINDFSIMLPASRFASRKSQKSQSWK